MTALQAWALISLLWLAFGTTLWALMPRAAETVDRNLADLPTDDDGGTVDLTWAAHGDTPVFDQLCIETAQRSDKLSRDLDDADLLLWELENGWAEL